MTSAIRVAVIGVGTLGEHHARIYAQLPSAQLVAVVDLREDRARTMAARFETRACTHFEDVLPEVDAVSLAVPTLAHAEIAVACLARGIHTLVEKPIAADLPSAHTMQRTAEENRAILMVGHSERFNPAVEAVRDHVTEPLFYEAHRMSVYSGRSLDIDVVLDLMIHDLDLVLEFTSSPLKEVRTAGIPILSSRIDIANARLEFENGCVANLTASRVSNERIRKLRFFQPDAYVSIDLADQSAQMYSLVNHFSGRTIVPRQLEVGGAEPLAREIQVFLESIQSGATSPLPPAADGQAGIKVLDLAHRLLEEMDHQLARRGPK